MQRFAILLLLPVVPLLAGCGGDAALAQEGAAKAAAAPTESCVDCHRKLNPELIAHLESSPHAKVPVLCEDCHGTDHDKILDTNAAVPPSTCAQTDCHPKEYEEFARSRHGRRWQARENQPLFQEVAVAVGNCSDGMGCHAIQRPYPDGSVGRCGTCHPTHSFSNHEARNPRICLQCHGGVNHGQYEAWLRSAHSLESPTRDGPIADCVECHGTHDVSGGITHGLSPEARDAPPTPIPTLDAAEFRKAREEMIGRCRKCHGLRFARESLREMDELRRRWTDMLADAEGIVRGLAKDGLLDPAPIERIPNPLCGTEPRIGGDLNVDESASLPESLYYDLYVHYYSSLFRRVYHTDPKRVSWVETEKFKLKLNQLRTIARDLRRRKAEEEKK